MKLGFKLIINIDRMFNILTGGDLGVCFSTRCYINSFESERWAKVMSLVDKLMMEKDHCKKSYYWERRVKMLWLTENCVDIKHKRK